MISLLSTQHETVCLYDDLLADKTSSTCHKQAGTQIN